MLIPILQIITSIALIVLILLQERSAGTSGIFGGSDEFYHTRRGLERSIFIATIILVVVFAGLSLINLII
jgi:preprotein translocase subunit SecG